MRFTPVADLDRITQVVMAAGVLAVIAYLYHLLRRLAGAWVLAGVRRNDALGEDREALSKAFAANLEGWWRSLATAQPRGWTRRTRKQLEAVLAEADGFVQKLNDRYASPSGSDDAKEAKKNA
jgi:hypothetical protein